MAEVVTQHQVEMQTAKQTAEEAQELLYNELIQQQEELAQLRQRLQYSETRAAALEQAATFARDHVGHILDRLPNGAISPAPEQLEP